MLHPRSLSLVALAALILPRPARAQCTLVGDAVVGAVRVPGAEGPFTLRERARVVLRGAEARVEGVAPIAFEGTAPAGAVTLFLRAPQRIGGVVGIGAGLPFVASRADGPWVIGTVRSPAGLTVGGVSVPCAALTLEAPAAAPEAAPVPEHRANPRWIPHTTAREVFRCTERGGARGCATVNLGRCQPIGDGSVCGYHPSGGALTVFAAPSDRPGVRRVRVRATRDIVFADEDRRGPWLLLRSRSYSGEVLVVRGWVRASEVRWRQETPPHLLSSPGGVTTAGWGVAGDVRRGYGEITPGSAVMSRDGTRWGATAGPWCAQVFQWEGQATLAVPIPGAAPAMARVRPEDVRWVDRCEAVEASR
ncbi:MAG: hypothetical protein EPO40_08235 [Myxococcaceae bacterium]|nr:MAG: hypothetical protein EPO40_08235 [Myxococcaceae bacterium]